MTDEEMKLLFDISERCGVPGVISDTELKLIRKAFWELMKYRKQGDNNG